MCTLGSLVIDSLTGASAPTLRVELVVMLLIVSLLLFFICLFVCNDDGEDDKAACYYKMCSGYRGRGVSYGGE